MIGSVQERPRLPRLPLGSTKVLAVIARSVLMAVIGIMLRAWVWLYVASGGACTVVAGGVRGVPQVRGVRAGARCAHYTKGRWVHIRGAW